MTDISGSVFTQGGQTGALPLTNLVTVLQQMVQNQGRTLQAIQGLGLLQWVATPATAASTGIAGQISYDATHVYICVAANSWCRVAIAAW